MSHVPHLVPASTVPARELRTGLVIRHDQRDRLVVRTHLHRRLGEVMVELADPAVPGFTTVFLPAQAPVSTVGAA